MMPPARDGDWTTGAAKWAAVLTLGGASIFGMAWSITSRRPIVPAQAVVEEERVASEPGRVILREESEPPPRAARASPPRAPAQTARLNVNTATAAELELLPGIGPALARRIIDDRVENGPFRTVDDLDRVRGIGPKTLERIRDLVSVE